MNLIRRKLRQIVICSVILPGALWIGISDVFAQATPPEDLGGGVASIAAGGFHALALKQDGTVVGWGLNLSGESTPPVGLKDVALIAAGAHHSLALKTDGSVVAWGNNASGQTDVPSYLRLSQQQRDSVPMFRNKRVIRIAAGFNHSLALLSDGTVVGWGNYDETAQEHMRVGLIGVKNVSEIAAELGVSLVIADGHIMARATGPHHDRHFRPPTYLARETFTSIAAGDVHALALHKDGRVLAWGHPQYGKTIVPPEFSMRPPSRPGDKIKAIAAGSYHNLLLTEHGEVVAFGKNQFGQSNVPPEVKASKIRQVAAGTDFSLALTEDGRVIGWGFDKFKAIPKNNPPNK